MNNGVSNNTQNDITNTNNTMEPMAGVKIAPPADEPVNASNSSTATSALGSSVAGSSVVGVNNTDTTTSATQEVPVITSTLSQTNQTPVVTSTVQNSSTTPVITQSVNADTNNPTPVSTIPTGNVSPTENNNNNNNNNTLGSENKPKKRSSLVPILLLIIIGLSIYIMISSNEHKSKIQNLLYNCTPVTASKEATKLDLDSTLVKDLYSRVETNIKEDLANPVFDDNMRIYLAYRQIPDTFKYESNCNLFDATSMEPFICNNENGFTPKAFKVDTLDLAIKKMYGDKTNLELQNIQLGSSCIGGYQYIPDRGEYVQGYCLKQPANLYKVTKKLKEATSNKNTIVLVEEVEYHQSQQNPVPESLKNGLYVYTFRLDMNYNYVLVSKEYKEKY